MLITELAHETRTRLPWPAALPASAGAGLLLLLSFPRFGLWWCTPFAVALLAVAVRGQRVLAGFGLGMVAGLVFFFPLLSWTSTQVGPMPWVLLSSLEGVYLGLLGAAAAFCTPLILRYRWSWAPLTAVLWGGQEVLRSHTPFGGFPWGRLAFSQADSPAVRYAVLGGAPLVTFVVALAGGLLAVALWRLRIVPALAAVALVAAGLAVPVAGTDGRKVVIAIVQGNVPRLGLDFNAQRRAVLDNHASATLELAQQVTAGKRPRPALVVWPENSSDIDPLDNTDAAQVIDSAAQAIGAPILVGAVLDAPGTGPGGVGRVRNAALLWVPGQGPVQEYTKQHPVPFAEYIPMRTLVRKITKLVDRVRSDFVPGTAPGVMTVPGGGPVIGDAICFEVAYDSLVRATVDGGAQLLVTQTNNATFNTAEAEQQLAMVRLRSVEHGRSGLMASTVGVSAFVDSGGSVHDATAFNTRAVLVREVALSNRRTLATRLGDAPEVILAILALFGIVATVAARRRRQPGHQNEEAA
ncbi:apolipoprotein N-acyltransferase [Longispora albida]|uniref:apolipoprotein N-acyltransferase n=1 Tax=Longispora albida TaxID=203523 RepID=UPI0003655C5E|nr:apolipoprotein N-acyltransferase [Longispora albida]